MADSFVGGYQIVGELGRGAMGIVYHAIDPKIRRSVAIKQIRLDPGASPEEGATLRHRLVREARSAGVLSHPGIVTVYHLGEEASDIFIVMEHVDGVSLESALAANTLDIVGKVEILRQTAAALDFAHRSGIVHRDVKPGNILLRGDGVVKIADFGIAKVTQELTATGNLTNAGSSLGSPAYMSPEQVRAAQVDGRSDQFSLAIIAFQMLTGRMPFAADSAHALMYQIVMVDPLANPSELPPAVTAALAPAFAKDPAHRYPSCTAMVQALSQAVGMPGAGVANVPPPAAVAKTPSLLLAGAAVIALVIAAAGGYLWWKSKSAGGTASEAPIVKAASLGKLEEVKHLLADGADIDQKNAEGTTALMVASGGTAYITNNVPLVTFLIAKGAKIDLEDARGRTALELAAAGGKAEAAKLLLEKQADPNHKGAEGSTPLLQAIYYGHAAVLPVLIGGGANVELANTEGTTPLMLAAEGTAYVANNTPMAVTMIEIGAIRDVRDGRGRTALYRAAAAGKEQVVRLLVQGKADPNVQAEDGSTALIAAVTYAKLGTVKALIECGANVELTDSSGSTALIIASEGTAYMTDNEPLVAALLGAGAKVDSQDQQGRTALFRASGGGKPQAQKLLLDRKATINLKSNDGATPLANAVAYGKLESAKLLLERGAAVDLADGNGVTPLMIAARKPAYMDDAKPFVQLLLAHKARKDLTDSQGHTPLQLAEAARNSSVLDLLKGR